MSPEKLAEENRQWEKNQSRIREYLETLSPAKREEVETAALVASPFGRGKIPVRLSCAVRTGISCGAIADTTGKSLSM